MNPFKYTRYAELNPGLSLPRAEPLDAEAAAGVRARLALIHGCGPDTAGDALLEHLSEKAVPYDETRANEPGFDLGTVLNRLGIEPEPYVLINWYHFDEIDRIQYPALRDHFKSYWYPGPDDIDIFDRTGTWLVMISPEGYIRHVPASV